LSADSIVPAGDGQSTDSVAVCGQYLVSRSLHSCSRRAMTSAVTIHKPATSSFIQQRIAEPAQTISNFPIGGGGLTEVEGPHMLVKVSG